MASTHLTKKEIQHDPLTATVEHQVENLAAHKGMVKMVGIGLAVVIVAFGGYKLYSGQQATARGEALVEARRVLSGTVGTQTKPGLPSFPTQEAKDKAQMEAWAKLAGKYPGSAEGAIAQFNLAGMKIDAGDVDGAAAAFRDVADRGPKEFASSAKLSLAQILWGQGKIDDANKLFDDLENHPTSFVSSDEAILVHARLLSDTKPVEAIKMLDKLKDAKGPALAGRVELMGKITQKMGN